MCKIHSSTKSTIWSFKPFKTTIMPISLCCNAQEYYPIFQGVFQSLKPVEVKTDLKHKWNFPPLTDTQGWVRLRNITPTSSGKVVKHIQSLT